MSVLCVGVIGEKTRTEVLPQGVYMVRGDRREDSMPGDSGGQQKPIWRLESGSEGEELELRSGKDEVSSQDGAWEPF